MPGSAGDRTPHSGIHAAIDRYLGAASRAGVPKPDGPAAERDLDAIRNAIAPLVLPDDVLVMWRRLQAPPGMPYPGWVGARDALDIWREDVSASGRGLPIFPIAYESHGFLSIGLVGDGRESLVWSWAYDAEPARLRFRSLAIAFETAADALEQGVFAWRTDHRYLEVVDHPAWEAIIRTRNDEALAEGTAVRSIETVDLQSPLSWPDPWKQAAGVDVGAAAARGASTTIRALIEARSAPATIAGTIVALMGGGEGSRITVDDGTGRLVVWCPAQADPYYVVRIGNVVEIDLLARPGTAGTLDEAELARLQAEIQDAALRGDLAAAQAAAMPLVGFAAPDSADVIASAVRPGGG
jgi:hypothetical protein